MVERPRVGGTRTEAEGAHDVGGTMLTIQVELGNRRSATLEDDRHGEVEVPGRHLGDQHGLVVAALAGTIGVDGNGDEQVTTRAGPFPAPGDRTAERLGEAPFAGVLQLV